MVGIKGVRGAGLTDTTPQLNALMRKQESTHTHPYPPSGGGSIAATSCEPSTGDVHVSEREDHFAMEIWEIVEVGEFAVDEPAGEFGEDCFSAEVRTANRRVGGR